MDESSLLLRQIPHSIEAEQSVLGAMLIDARCIPDVVEALTGEDFYLKANREIYETIYTMFNFSATIDPVTVLDQMKLTGVYDENTSRSYLLQLMEITPTAANVKEYIRIVKDKALLRRIAETAGELTTLVQEGGETAQAVLDLAEQRVYAIRQGRSAQGLEPLSKILVDVFDQLQELSMSGSEVPGMATGFGDLDRTLTGFHGSELILLAARPGMGKTSFALNVLLHAGKFSGKSVVFFSLEMSREQLATRLISSEAFLDNKKLMTGKLSPDDWDKVTLASTALAHTKIYIDDNPSPVRGRHERQVPADRGPGHGCHRLFAADAVLWQHHPVRRGKPPAGGGRHQPGPENHGQGTPRPRSLPVPALPCQREPLG